MEDDIFKYLTYLKKEASFSLNTIISYQKDLESFKNFINKKNLNYLDLKREDIIDYLKYLDEKKLKNSSISRKISCFRSFYNYLLEENKINKNIFKIIKNPKLEKKVPNYLNYEELRIILDSLNYQTDEGLLNRLLIELFYATGCRVSEIIAIKLEDIDRSNKKIRIMGKGSKERIVYYGEYAEEFLDKYLSNLRPRLANKENPYLFIDKKGKQFNINEMELRIKDIVKNLSLKSHVTPHTFRHTFATHLLNNGADIKTVQELLGHANLNTTGIYTHISNEELRKTYLNKFRRN